MSVLQPSRQGYIQHSPSSSESLKKLGLAAFLRAGLSLSEISEIVALIISMHPHEPTAHLVRFTGDALIALMGEAFFSTFGLIAAFFLAADGLKSSESSESFMRLSFLAAALIAPLVLGLALLSACSSSSRRSYNLSSCTMQRGYGRHTCHSAKKLSRSVFQMSCGVSLSSSTSSCSLASRSWSSLST